MRRRLSPRVQRAIAREAKRQQTLFDAPHNQVSEQTTNEMPALREGLVSSTDDDQQMPGKRRIYGDLSEL